MIGRYEKIMNETIREVERILKENERSQGVHISIDITIDAPPAINFTVDNRFPEISEE